MSKTRDNILVGILITVSVVIAIVGSLWLARGGLSKGYPLYANFSWGAGMKTGAPVWVSGADVGYVARVEFRADGKLLTELRITSDQPIPRGSLAEVVPNGLFGDVAINFKPIRAAERYRAADTVPVAPPSPGIAGLTAKADSISTSVNALTSAINQELVAGGGLADMRKTLAGTNQLIAQLNKIAVEQSTQLTLTMSSLRRTADAVDSAKIDSTLANMRAASANLQTMTTTLDSATRAMNSIVAKIDDGTGTAGKLINDPAIFNDVRSLLLQVDGILTDLKQNPKKYLKFSVF